MPKDGASFWVSTTSTVMLGGKCGGTTTLSAGAGILVGTNTYLTLTINSDLILPSWAKEYSLQLSSNTGGQATFSPLCVSSTASPQPTAFFDVDAAGKIIVKPSAGTTGPNSALNFESKDDYGFMIKVQDTTAGGLTPIYVPVRITLTDLNEPPIWGNDCASDASVIACCSIPEMSAVSTVVDQFYGGALGETSHIQANDADAADRLTYTIFSGNTLVGSSSTPAFALDTATAVNVPSGQKPTLRVASSALDTEASVNPFYDLLLQVKDADGLAATTGTGRVRVYLKDVNEPPSLSDMTVSCLETAGEGTVWNVRAIDTDPTPPLQRSKLRNCVDACQRCRAGIKCRR